MIRFFCAYLLIVPLCVSAEEWVITVVDSSGGPFVSIAVDSASHPHIAYNSYQSKAEYLKYAGYDSSSWVIETVDTAGRIDYVSLSLDRSGVPHIGYFCEGNGDLGYARRDTAEWSIQTVDTTGTVGEYVSIGITSSGFPGMSYYDETAGDLRYAEWDGGQWLIERVDTTGDVGRYTSLAFDEVDNPHISYYDATNYSLKYSRKNGIDWLMAVVDTPDDVYGRVGLYTSLALDSLGYPHISYHYKDWAGGMFDGLRYAKWNGSEWLIQSVDWGFADLTVGVGSSIALDSRGYPCIAYKRIAASDIPPHDVVHAQWNGAGWDAGRVDSFPSSEGKVSLSLDIADHPHIAYHVFAWDFGLKYATRATSVEENQTLHISGGVVLFQNYPNPFSEFTDIYFWMNEHPITDPHPRSEIYDMSGRLVNSFQVYSHPKGLNLIRWDGKNGLGRPVAGGVYFYRLKLGEIILTKKMVIVR